MGNETSRLRDQDNLLMLVGIALLIATVLAAVILLSTAEADAATPRDITAAAQAWANQQPVAA